MELPKINILNETEPLLREVSKNVIFPLSESDKNLIFNAIKYLEMSQIEEYSTKYSLRPGMGLSFPQLGILKRIFVISEEIEENKFKTYIIINPKVISESEEYIYVGEGEGCLSVERDVEGIVPRKARLTVKANDINGDEITLRVREDIAVAFQHEIDHLNGKLFIDHIDPNKPYKNYSNMREI